MCLGNKHSWKTYLEKPQSTVLLTYKHNNNFDVNFTLIKVSVPMIHILTLNAANQNWNLDDESFKQQE